MKISYLRKNMHLRKYTAFLQPRFVALVMKRKFGKVTKILKILCLWLSSFYFFINSSNCYSHILPGIYLIFLKNVTTTLELNCYKQSCFDWNLLNLS